MMLPVMMKSSVLLCLAVSFAIFGLGVSLQCHYCPNGSTSDCEIKQECNPDEDACLKVTSGETTYTTCVRYADCNFQTLSTRYIVPSFTFNCCQKNNCNGPKKSLSQRIKEFFG